MSSNRKPVRWLALAMAAALFLSGWAHPAAAFTDKQVREIFDALGGTDGKVTNVDFQMNKINAMFFRHRKRDQRHMRFTYEETLFSRAFFDKADSGHKGYLDALDVTNAIRFDDIDTRHRGYFEYADLVAYLKKIGR